MPVPISTTARASSSGGQEAQRRAAAGADRHARRPRRPGRGRRAAGPRPRRRTPRRRSSWRRLGRVLRCRCPRPKASDLPGAAFAVPGRRDSHPLLTVLAGTLGRLDSSPPHAGGIPPPERTAGWPRQPQEGTMDPRTASGTTGVSQRVGPEGVSMGDDPAPAAPPRAPRADRPAGRRRAARAVRRAHLGGDRARPRRPRLPARLPADRQPRTTPRTSPRRSSSGSSGRCHSYTPGTFEGWLHRITTNLFLDQARRKQRIRFDALPDDAGDRLAGARARPGPGRTTTRHFDADVQAALDAAAAGLPRRRRAVRHRGL